MEFSDQRSHYRIVENPKQAGFDPNAVLVMGLGLLGAFLCLAILGMFFGLYFTGVLLGAAVFGGAVVFALKFINNKPPTYFNDWRMSRKEKDYSPVKECKNT